MQERNFIFEDVIDDILIEIEPSLSSKRLFWIHAMSQVFLAEYHDNKIYWPITPSIFSIESSLIEKIESILLDLIKIKSFW